MMSPLELPGCVGEHPHQTIMRPAKDPYGGRTITRPDPSPGQLEQRRPVSLRGTHAGAVYSELRHLADAYLRRERPNHTLQSTALVHEAFLRLIQQQVEWQNRAHFYGIAAQMIRRILLDYARSHGAGKRGAGAVRLELGRALAVPQQLPDVDVLALNDALDRLAAMDERQSRIVELRFFGGLSIPETAELLHLSVATVNREWATAKAWLFREVSRDRPDDVQKSR